MPCCFCAEVKPFDAPIAFAILSHPIEVKRRISTGRLSHLCLNHSFLIDGVDYSEDPQVNALLDDPRYHSVVLAPGESAVDLTPLSLAQRLEMFPQDKTLLVHVIDGTWQTANKTLRLSKNLQSLPRICFTPPTESRFLVRQQPKEGCYSTVEAIHHTLELLAPNECFPQANNLLDVFDWMVRTDLQYRQGLRKGSGTPYRAQHREKWTKVKLPEVSSGPHE